MSEKIAPYNMYDLTGWLAEDATPVLPEYEADTGLLYDSYVGYLNEKQEEIVGEMVKTAKLRGNSAVRIWSNELRLATEDVLFERSAKLDKAISEKKFEEAIQIYRGLHHDHKSLVTVNPQVLEDEGMFGITAARLPAQRAELRIYQAGKEADPLKKLNLLELAVSNYKNSIELLSKQDGESKLVTDELAAVSQRLVDLSEEMGEHYKRAANAEKDPAKSVFYKAQGLLLEGNIAAAKLALMDVKRLGGESEVANEARIKLHNLTLAALDQMIGDMESVAAQRERRLLGRGPKYQAESGIGYLTALRSLVEEWKADTVDEARRILRDPRSAGIEILTGWEINLPYTKPHYRDDKERFDTEKSAARTFYSDYNSDSSNPALYDVREYKDLPSIRLNGGTLNVKGALDIPEQIRVVIGKEGGTIRHFPFAGGLTYHFPKSDRERLVFIDQGVVNPNGNECETKVTPALHKYTDETDPDTKLLLLLESNNGLKQMLTKESREEFLLKIGKGFKKRLGSYAVAGMIWKELFTDDLRAEMEKMSEEEIRKIVKDVEENASVDKQEMAILIETRLMKAGMQRLYDKYDAMDADDPKKATVSARAWTLYEEMLDPLDRLTNISSETWDEIGDEAMLTTATLPVTAGVGASLRVGIGATSFISRLITGGGLRGFLAKGAVFTIGSLGEGVAMEVGSAAAYGRDIDLKNIGINTAFSFGFHMGGKAFKGSATALENAARTSTSSIRRIALRSAATAGQLATQTTASTTLGEIQALVLGEEQAGTLGERVLGHAGRMVGFHYGNKVFHGLTGNVLLTAEQRLQARQQMTVDIYKNLVSNGVPRDSAERMANNIAKRRIPDILPQELKEAGRSLADSVVEPFKKAGEALADAIDQGNGPSEGMVAVTPDGATISLGLKNADRGAKGPIVMMVEASNDGSAGNGKTTVAKSDKTQVVDLGPVSDKRYIRIGRGASSDVILEGSQIPGPQVLVSRVNGGGKYTVEAVVDGTEIVQGSVIQTLHEGDSLSYSAGERINIRVGGVSLEIILPGSIAKEEGVASKIAEDKSTVVEKADAGRQTAVIDSSRVVADGRRKGATVAINMGGDEGMQTVVVDPKKVGEANLPDVPRPAEQLSRGGANKGPGLFGRVVDFFRRGTTPDRSVPQKELPPKPKTIEEQLEALDRALEKRAFNRHDIITILQEMSDQIPKGTIGNYYSVLDGSRSVETLPEPLRRHFRRVIQLSPEGRFFDANGFLRKLGDRVVIDIRNLPNVFSPEPQPARSPVPASVVQPVVAPVPQPRIIPLEVRVVEPDGTSRTISLSDFNPDTEHVWTIGRNRGHAIRVVDRYVSLAHAEIRYRPNVGFEIRDVGSSNGTNVRVTGRAIAADDIDTDTPTMWYPYDVNIGDIQAEGGAGDYHWLSRLGDGGMAVIDIGPSRLEFVMPSHMTVRNFRRVQESEAQSSPIVEPPQPSPARPVRAEQSSAGPTRRPVEAAPGSVENAFRRIGFQKRDAEGIADQIRDEFRRRENEHVYVDPDQIDNIAGRLMRAANALERAGSEEGRALIQILEGELKIGIRPGQRNIIFGNAGQNEQKETQVKVAAHGRLLEVDSDPSVSVKREVSNPYPIDKARPSYIWAMSTIWQEVYNKTGRRIDEDPRLAGLHRAMLATEHHNVKLATDVSAKLTAAIARNDVAAILEVLKRHKQFEQGVAAIQDVLGLAKKSTPDLSENVDEDLRTVALSVDLPQMANIGQDGVVNNISRILAEKVWALKGSDFLIDPKFDTLRQKVGEYFWGEGGNYPESAWNKMSPSIQQQLLTAIRQNNIGLLLTTVEDVFSKAKDRNAYAAVRAYRRFVGL